MAWGVTRRRKAALCGYQAPRISPPVLGLVQVLDVALEEGKTLEGVESALAVGCLKTGLLQSAQLQIIFLGYVPQYNS